MNRDISPAAQVYVAEIWGKIVGFIAVLHFPHPTAKNIKRVTRLVVLPDYQGIGVGKALLNYVAELYHKKGFRMTITTSHPSLNKSMKFPWRLIRQGRVAQQGRTSKIAVKNTLTVRRHTCSWEYKK